MKSFLIYRNWCFLSKTKLLFLQSFCFDKIPGLSCAFSHSLNFFCLMWTAFFPVMPQTDYNKPAGIYLLKVNNRNTGTRCEICSKLTIKIPERRQWRIFVVNFEHISHLDLVFLLLTLNIYLPAGNISKHSELIYTTFNCYIFYKKLANFPFFLDNN